MEQIRIDINETTRAVYSPKTGDITLFQGIHFLHITKEALEKLIKEVK